MYSIKNIFFSALLLFTFFIVSCSSGLEPIFAGIETEVKIQTNNLNDKASAFGMAKIDDYYVIATGTRLFKRKIDGTTWSVQSIPGYTEGREIVAAGDIAYVLAANESHTKSRIFKIEAINGALKLSPIDNGIDEKENIQKILYVRTGDAGEGTLLAQTAKDINGGYGTYINSENTANSINLAGSTDEDGAKKNNFTILQDSAFVPTIDTIFVLTETQLYTLDSAANEFSTYVARTQEDGKTVTIGSRSGGIMYVEDLDQLYVSDSRGDPVNNNVSYIWRGTVDTINNEIVWLRSNSYSNPYFFTDFTYIAREEESLLLVGTRYKDVRVGRDWGFREMVVQSSEENGVEVLAANIDSIKVPRGSYYTSVNLDESAVLGFFVDDDVVFILTRNGGLWRGNYESRTVNWFLE